MNRYILLWAFSLIPLLCVGQKDNSSKDLDWGFIPDKDREMSQFKELDSEAIVLFDKGALNLKLESGEAFYRFSRHKRIKMLSDKGNELLKIELPYISDNKGEEKITYFQVYIHDNTGKKKLLSQKNIITAAIDKRHEMKRVLLPTLEAGTILEYRYELLSPHIDRTFQWYFQEDFPVRLSTLTVEIPSAFKYAVTTRGMGNMEHTEGVDKGLNLAGKKITMIQDNVYKMENLPPLKSKAFLSDPNQYRASILLQLRAIEFPLQGENAYIKNWNDVAQKLKSDLYFGQQYLKKSKHNKFITDEFLAIANAPSSQYEKMTRMADFVQRSLKWNNKYGLMPDRTLNELKESQTANSGSINLLFLSLLRAAGIEAFPALVSTYQNGKVKKSFPSVAQFDHLYVQAELDGESYLLDTGIPQKGNTLLRKEVHNKYAYLMDDLFPRWIEINSPISTTTHLASFVLDESGETTGVFQGKYKGYKALTVRQKLMDQDNIWKNYLPNLSIENKVIKNEKDLDKSLVYSTEMKLKDFAQLSDNTLRFKPILVSDFFENSLIDSTRSLPLDLPYPLKELNILQVKLPDSYQLKSLPKALNIALADKSATFNYLTEVVDGELQILSQLSLDRSSFGTEAYEDLREFFIQVAQKLNENVVLIRKK